MTSAVNSKDSIVPSKKAKAGTKTMNAKAGMKTMNAKTKSVKTGMKTMNAKTGARTNVKRPVANTLVKYLKTASKQGPMKTTAVHAPNAPPSLVNARIDAAAEGE